MKKIVVNGKTVVSVPVIGRDGYERAACDLCALADECDVDMHKVPSCSGVYFIRVYSAAEVAACLRAKK